MSDAIELQKIVGQVAAAYFSNNHVIPAEIATVINQIATSLGAVAAPVVETPVGVAAMETPVGAPAVDTPVEAPERRKLSSAQIRKSITPDALISFEDNKPYKTLRRHLSVRGLTPDEYRAKWDLPRDYPMVAPSYSQARSNLAKALGLGSRKGAQPQPTRAAAARALKGQTRSSRTAVRTRRTKAAGPTAAAE